MRNEKQDVVMTASSKFLYYTSRIIHLLLLPILYIGILWFPDENRWTVTGLLLLFIAPLTWFFSKKNILLLFLKCAMYICTIIIFFPTELFSTEYPFNYKNVIFYDICFLATVDISIFFERKSLERKKNKK